MTHRWALPSASLLLAAASLLAAGCEDDSKYAKYSMKPPAEWAVPRMPDGTPDLQGVWGNNSVTPMIRPWQWKDKTVLTDAEVEELQAFVAIYLDQQGETLFFGTNLVQLVLNARGRGEFKQIPSGAKTSDYNRSWTADREWDNRTSLIIDPPDGQFPALTPEAEKRSAAPRPRGPFDGPEDRPLSERCISYGAPRIGANYNSYVQIIQTPETVVLLQEMIHDARVVPMTGKPHLPMQVLQLHGDPRGRWEGDSLVVETTNYSDGFHGSTPGVTVTERYTRVGPDFINWEITVDDPATWTRPFTFMIRLKKANALIYEYACHEGNYSMEGILAGARREEALKEAKK